MPKVSRGRWQHLCLTVVLGLGLLLAACTRSASQAVVPTATEGSGVSEPIAANQAATMDAIATELTIELTATTAAGETAATQPAGATPSGGGAVDTAVTPATPTDIPTIAPTPEPPAASESCASPYTVLEGDWIYKIARACGLDPSAIVDANPGVDPNNVVPGQILILPIGTATSQTLSPIAGCTGSHTVVTGDTLFSLAYGCGFTAEELAASNNIAFPYTIFPGDVLTFP